MHNGVVAAIAVAAFAGAAIGYVLGWRHRGERAAAALAGVITADEMQTLEHRVRRAP